MMKNLLHCYPFLLFAMLFCILPSCSEDNPGGGTQYNEIHENLFSFLFEPGSYWIYSRNEHNMIDSIYLTDQIVYNLSSVSVGQGNSIVNQEYKISYTSSLAGTYSEYLVGYIISRGSVSGGYIYLSSYQIGDVGANARIENIFDSLAIKETTFYNVVMMKITKDNYIETDMHLYYADSIGVIKKEILDGEQIIETWDLMSYNSILKKQW